MSLSRGCSYTDRVSQTAEIRSLVWTLESEIQAQAGPCCLRDPGGAFLASSWLPVRSPRQTLAYSGGPAQGTERLPRHRVFSSWGEMGHTGLSPPHSSMASPATTLFRIRTCSARRGDPQTSKTRPLEEAQVRRERGGGQVSQGVFPAALLMQMQPDFQPTAVRAPAEVPTPGRSGPQVCLWTVGGVKDLRRRESD